ncbi:hypothetical protein IFR05_000684 [Cadophora sp. M221]|nr:hypothetical protein IFR05_000684 [Cadophora sp. M221]
MFDIHYLTFDDEANRTWSRGWPLYDDPNERKTLYLGPMGYSALQLAVAFSGSAKLVKILIMHKADIDFRCRKDHAAPVLLAAIEQQVDALNILLRNGANPNSRAANGCTPAILAATKGSVECLLSLRAVGADLDACGEFGETICHIAAQSSPKFLSYLFYAGHDIYRKDYDGKSAVAVAAMKSRSSPAFLSLLCNIDLDFNQCSGLIACFPLLRKRAIKFLLRRLPEQLISLKLRSTTSKRGSGSILSEAARRGNWDLIEILIEAGGPLELELDGEGTPFVAACAYGRDAVMKILVRAGANVAGTKNGLKYSAMEAAMPFPHMVRWLLVDRFTDQGKLTEQQASGNNHPLQNWSGPRVAEVVIKNLYQSTAGTSSWTLALELSSLRRNLRGRVVVVRGLYS